MMRRRDRVKLFWGDVAQALGLEDVQIQTPNFLRRHFFTGFGLSGTTARDELVAYLFAALGEFAVEAGVSHRNKYSNDFTYVAVSVEGLPLGFTVGPRKAQQPRRLRGQWIDCDGGGGKEVAAIGPKTVRSDVDGLRIEQEIEGFDLMSFLTDRRRQVICSLDCEIVKEGDHKLWTSIPGIPHPRRRDISRAAQGDIEATQSLGESRDKVVELIRTALSEAELVTRELRVQHTP